MKEVDRRGRLAEEPFSYRVTKDNRVFISWQGKQVTALGGEESEEFLVDIQGTDALEAQLIMARATGNFKRGNEKGRGIPMHRRRPR